jgi:cytidylate kinase
LLGVDWRELDASQHEAIDSDTRAWASAEPNGVVEGRYLDAVLESGMDAAFVLLSASDEVRLNRWTDRLDRSVSDDELKGFDQAEMDFRSGMYGTATVSPTIQIDTSTLSTDEVAVLIRVQLEKL